ncbi:uncharacterized protein LOC121646930 [Melanotaenia boesemani]|uniref:uncharacterized protein LOC121646930 n=1 Tax=Melanotaenia boesemani TaxID=1250792 RepID=UPI001C044E56|nr:uncharacterized protein LOC121646930 [Melanotaenia boesemani]
MTRFSLERFKENPTLEQIEACRKDDLAVLADFFEIPLPKYVKKKEMRELVVAGLVERKVLRMATDATDEAEIVVVEPLESAGPSGAWGSGETEQKGLLGSDKVEEVKLASDGPVTPVTLPRFEPMLSEEGSNSSVCNARVKLRLARLQLEAEEKAQERQIRLEIKRMEIEAETAVRIRQMELEAQTKATVIPASGDLSRSSTPPSSSVPLDLSKFVSFMPSFRENEVDCFFTAFERVAIALKWPKECWSVLIQCKITGKAQEVVSSLPLLDCQDYDTIKSTILKAYELVPEAYRQKFCSHRKNSSHTHVEFAREKSNLFDKWCAACSVKSFEALRELILLEEFKKQLPESLVVHLNEQRVDKLFSAAVFADEYTLTHKTVFQPTLKREEKSVTGMTFKNRSSEERACFYCHQPGHLIRECPKLAAKEKPSSSSQKGKGVGFTKRSEKVTKGESTMDPCFQPFTMPGTVALAELSAEERQIKVLRDTGASQTLMLAKTLPFSEASYAGYSVILKGIGKGYEPCPIHYVHLKTELISGRFPIAICDELPIDDISLLLGNDIARGKVTPALEVMDQLSEEQTAHSCVVTRAQARQNKSIDQEDVDLTDSFLFSPSVDEEQLTETDGGADDSNAHASEQKTLPTPADSWLSISREALGAAQREDPSLRTCFEKVVRPTPVALFHHRERDALVVIGTPALRSVRGILPCTHPSVHGP